MRAVFITYLWREAAPRPNLSKGRNMAGSPAFEPLMIVNAVPKQMLNGLFATHPSTEQRVQRLLAMQSSPVSLA
jgi:Zn-dependent protease with chaperone function